MSKIIDEVKAITANEVAKNQDAAKLNFPALIDRIKVVAALGESECIVPLSQMNEYDKKLLTDEGFMVSLLDIDKRFDDISAYSRQSPKKEWIIRW